MSSVAPPLDLAPTPHPQTATRTAAPNLWRDTARNILRQRSAVVGLAIIALLVFVAVFADVVRTHDPNQSMLDAHETGAKVRAAAVHPPPRLSGEPTGALLRARCQRPRRVLADRRGQPGERCWSGS